MGVVGEEDGGGEVMELWRSDGAGALINRRGCMDPPT
jgi:hypothetical protein